MCLMFTLWGASPLGIISNVSPLGVPADLQSADKKGSTSLSGICNPPTVGFSYLQDRDAAFLLEADCKSARK